MAGSPAVSTHEVITTQQPVPTAGLELRPPHVVIAAPQQAGPTTGRAHASSPFDRVPEVGDLHQAIQEFAGLAVPSTATAARQILSLARTLPRPWRKPATYLSGGSRADDTAACQAKIPQCQAVRL